jgi:hypothetical protein
MSIRTSIILVVSLVMVAGYVFFVQIRGTAEVVDEPPWFYNVDLSDMTRISITDRGEEAVFFLGDDRHWHLDDPEGLPVGADRWGGINLLLTGPKSRRLLDAQPTDLAPYGLDQPPVRIEVNLRDGRTIPVLLGLPTPDGVGVYAQVEGFPQVFTIVAGWGQVMTRLITEPPYPSWYYDVDLSIVNRVRLQTPEIIVSLTEDDASWHFDDKAESPVDEAQLTAIFASLEQPSQQTLVEYGVFDLAQYGLEEPPLTLFFQTSVIREDGISVNGQILFRIGNAAEDGTGYYVQTEKDELFPDVFKVSADWVEELQAIVDTYPYAIDVVQES